MNYLKKILGSIRYADQSYNLINDGDKIAIGISGGKDSMALLYCLKIYQKFSCVNFKIYPVILDLGFPGFDASKISNYVSSLGLTLYVSDEKEVYEVLKEHKKDNKNLPCSICSRMKKAGINAVAHELGCNKVAFAHHVDDALETLFMNEIYGARIATFEPKMVLSRSDITFIRPFALVKENEIKGLVKEENIPYFPSHCPNDGYTKRAEIKDFLLEIYKKYPSSEKNFVSMLYNHEQFVLWFNNIDIKIEKSNLSLRPLINKDDVIDYAKLINKIGLKFKDLSTKDEHFLIRKNHQEIGYISYRYNDDKLFINKIYFLNNKEKYIFDILHHLERSSLKKANPFMIIILNSRYKKIYLENGYIKKDKTYSKLVYIK